MTTLYPLTAFEEYMLVDETVDHPMTFFFRVDLVGQIDVAEFSEAFSEVVARHPILWSTVVRRLGRRYWKVDPERMPTLVVRRTLAESACELKTHIDLEREPGLRAQLCLTGKSAELWLQFHHSCNDGIGGIRFLNELFDAYRLRITRSGSLAGSDSRLFPTRRCAFQNLTRLARINRLLPDAARIWNFLRRPLVTFRDRGMEDRQGLPSPTLSFIEARLPLTSLMLQRLKQLHPLAPTVNDVLLRDVYLALADWIEAQQAGGQNRWIRITAATNMRNPTAEQIRCHNDVSLVFLDRRASDLRDPSKLLGEISVEMSRIKRDKMGYALLRGLSWFRALPGGIAAAKKFRRVYATAVVSNLGNVFPPHSPVGCLMTGELTVAKLGFLVPIRSGTPVSFGVLTHAHEMTIGMQYDDGAISIDGARQLLNYLTARLSQSLCIDTQPITQVRRAA